MIPTSSPFGALEMILCANGPAAYCATKHTGRELSYPLRKVNCRTIRIAIPDHIFVIFPFFSFLRYHIRFQRFTSW